MHLHRIQISNFRALENIDVELTSLVNVVIGPNAIGKTTILEAIRLTKSVLAPRTQSEGQQTLHSLGIVSPHLPQQLLPRAVTHDPTKPTVIKCTFNLAPAEVTAIEVLIPRIIPELVLQSVGLSFTSPAQAMNFLGSTQGQAALTSAQLQITSELARLKSETKLNLNLTINFQTAQLVGEFPIQQVMYSSLERSLDPTMTLFSYFPADRAMPIGEQPIQLGVADTNQQLESYNSQPQLKYSRLKNMIFNTIIGSAKGREELTNAFSLIFEKVLKGRALGEIGINAIGMLSIPIIDTESGRTFDIDGLSSGEKGLILSSLLIARSIQQHGLILLDEPELHLNPAVCRELLQFFVDEFAVKKNMQAIICSHSAEILAGALERKDCSLFHLRNGTSLAKIRQQDQGEIRDALRRLGSSESEALLYRGAISVEGFHDVEILQAGFDDIVRRYKVKRLGGRTNVEEDIKDLQKLEKRGDEIGYHFFLFDLDRRPTTLADSKYVHLRQLKRYCLENYLLEEEIITDLSRDKDLSDNPINSVTETLQIMKRLAMEELHPVAAREVFKSFGLEDVCFDMAVLNTPNASNGFWQRIEMIQKKFGELEKLGFEAEFEKRLAIKLEELKALWDGKWRDLCNGKKVLEGLRREGYLKGDLLRVKRRIATQMKMLSTGSHNELAGILKDLLNTPSFIE